CVLVHPPRGRIRAKSKLVVPSNHVKIIAGAEETHLVRSALCLYCKTARNGELRFMRVVRECVDSKIGWSEARLSHSCRNEFAGGDSIRSKPERIGDVGTG